MKDISIANDTGVKLRKSAKVIFIVQVALWVIVGVVLAIISEGLGIVVGAIGIFISYFAYASTKAIADICYNSHATAVYLSHIDQCVSQLAGYEPFFVRDVAMPDIPNVDTTTTQQSF